VSRRPTALRPFFSYLGSKYKMAVRYPPPEHRLIVEPFAGSAGYSLNYWDRKVILYDVSSYIVGIWQYLIKVSTKEILSIPMLEEGQTVRDLDICQEARWLVGSWCGKASVGPQYTPTRWARTKVVTHNRWERISGRLVWVTGCQNKPYNRWGPEVRYRIASQLRAIRHWEIRELSYSESPDTRATWFVDPPYQSLAKVYNTPVLDYERLAQWCRDRRGLTIVCEDDSADWLPFEFLGRIGSRMKRRRSSTTEVVWINRQ
jgi:site-specific DNA-adenine methylase